MSRKAAPVTYTKSDIEELKRLASDNTESRTAKRASMVLRCIAGERVADIASALNERPNTVIKWRRRFSESGCRGLLNRPRGSSGVGYGAELELNLRRRMRAPPPDGHKDWTGELLAAELGVPAPAVRRRLRAMAAAPPPPKEIYTVQLVLEVTKESGMEDSTQGKEMMDLEFTARIIGKDGTVIEKKVRLDGALPTLEDFDLATKEGLLRDLGTMDRAFISARDQLTEGLANEYADAAFKKNTMKKKKQPARSK